MMPSDYKVLGEHAVDALTHEGYAAVGGGIGGAIGGSIVERAQGLSAG